MTTRSVSLQPRSGPSAQAQKIKFRIPFPALLGAGEKCSQVGEIARGRRMAHPHPAQIPLPVLGFPLLADSQASNTWVQ